MSERYRILLVLNGAGLLISSIVIGWFYMFMLLGQIVLWPVIPPIDVQVPGEARAWNMAHLEGITNGLMLIGFAAIAPMLALSGRQVTWFFWSALVTAWLFTLPAFANALAGTRGLAFGGGPFPGGWINNLIYVSGWPPVIAVHITFALLAWGAWQKLKQTAPTS